MLKKIRGFTLIELMVVVVIIGILAAIAIPNFIRMQKRAKESDVKSVAHTLQLSVEDYKMAPTWLGLKPSLAGELTNVLNSYLPQNVQCKQNPFNQGNYYGVLGGNSIAFAAPAAIGCVGYIFNTQATAYNIASWGGDAGIIILTLQEGS